MAGLLFCESGLDPRKWVYNLERISKDSVLWGGHHDLGTMALGGQEKPACCLLLLTPNSKPYRVGVVVGMADTLACASTVPENDQAKTVSGLESFHYEMLLSPLIHCPR